MRDGQKRRQEYGTERGDIKVGVLVMGIKGTKREKDNREGRNVAQGEGTLKGGCFSDRKKMDEVGKKQ